MKLNNNENIILCLNKMTLLYSNLKFYFTFFNQAK